jgi:hypothetical protein
MRLLRKRAVEVDTREALHLSLIDPGPLAARVAAQASAREVMAVQSSADWSTRGASVMELQGTNVDASVTFTGSK